MQDAINAVADGGYIKLLTNFETGGAVATYNAAGTKTDGEYSQNDRYYCKPKNFTVDFNGFSYTVSNGLVGSSGTVSQAFHLERPTSNYNDAIKLAENGNVNITFKNGSIIVGNQINARMFIQNYCNVTYQDITLDGTNLKGSNAYVSSNNCGDVKILGNTSILAKEGDVAFDVCVYASYPSVSVTVDTTGVIDGKIELSKSSSRSFANDGKLDIQKAVITKAIVYDSSLSSELETEEFQEKVTIEENVTVGDVDYGDLIRYVTEDNEVVYVATGWYKPSSDVNQWLYLDKQAESSFVARSFATLAADGTDETSLNLTAAKDVTTAKNFNLDMTADSFKDLTYTKLAVTDASDNFSFNITGNDKITSIAAGAGNDTLKPGDVESITLGGGSGADVFIFNGNNETITDFGTGADSINMPSSFRPANAEFTAANDKISLDFDGNVLAFENLGENEVSLSGGHVFATKFHSVDKQSITFTSVQSATYDGSESNFATIDAAAASAISITGNSLDNRIVGSNKGGTLNGGDGDDKFYVTDRENTAKYLFEHTAGSKEVVEGFDDRNDTLSVAAAADITEAKSSRSKLIFTVGKSDDITLKGDDIEKVSLQGGGFLTKDGHVSDANFRLFTNAKGKIDLTDLPYEGSGVTSIDATAATKSSVTLTANDAVKNVNLAANKKKDQFEYAGGTVSIIGYESGKDKLNIEEAGAITSFGLINDNDVAISVGGATNVISLQGAKDQEVLIHDGNSRGNSYSKFVFHANGVLYNKAKRPTEATISTGAGDYTADNSVKKVFAVGLGEAISITSGNVKSTLDASEAGVGVSLIGGAKNNKFVGSTGADLFVYNGGKDNVQDFDTNDKISFGDESFDMSGAKITASNKSLKFKFTSKNTLTLKSDGKISSASINGGDYTFAKNAYSTGSGTVSLTSQFSGTYKVGKDSDATDIYGANVKKNLTFKGTSAAESLVGGTKKTNFKGGGGNDIFVGNASAKDTFFYAKTDSGDKTIQGFDFSTSSKDKIKIASGTITSISKSGNDIDFTTKGGSLTLKNEDNTNVLIKANNTHYWFATENGDGYSSGELITADTKVTRAQANATGYAIVDLGYSTNLVKTEVAVKAGEFTFDSSGIHKTTT